MRSCFTIPFVVAGLIFSAQHLPAQFSLSQTFTQTSPGSRIGVGLRDIDADRAAALKLGSVTGVEVMVVEPGSPAEQAGIKSGDVLLSYNSESIIGAQQLGRLVSETPIGRKVKIEYSRDGKVSTVTVTTAPRTIRQWAGTLPLESLDSKPNWIGTVEPLPMPVPTPRFSWVSPQLGIECEGLDARNSQLAQYFGVKQGVLVRSVSKDSAAAKAGLRAGDVITQFDGHSVADPKEIMYYIRQEPQLNKPLPLEVMRDHKQSALKVNLTADQE
jgi:serine protease Do